MNKIINFHEINKIDWFDSVVSILKNKYNIISLEEVIDFYYNKRSIKNSCHLTFDDGDRTFYNVIFPILQKHKISASVYVSAYIANNNSNFWFQEIRGYNQQFLKNIISEVLKIDVELISRFTVLTLFKNLKIDEMWTVIETYKKKYNPKEKQPQNMTIKELLEVDKYKLITIGAHTNRHPILANEDDIVSEHEIVSSINQLSEILGHEIYCFAYPNGQPEIDYRNREMEILRICGCKVAFSTQSKNFILKDNPLAIPRFGLTYRRMSFIKAELLLDSYWEIIKGLKYKRDSAQRQELKTLFI